MGGTAGFDPVAMTKRRALTLVSPTATVRGGYSSGCFASAHAADAVPSSTRPHAPFASRSSRACAVLRVSIPIRGFHEFDESLLESGHDFSQGRSLRAGGKYDARQIGHAGTHSAGLLRHVDQATEDRHIGRRHTLVAVRRKTVVMLL